jgi:hypothetical protein
MAKFNGQVRLGEFKRAAGLVEIHTSTDGEWRTALAKARTWKAAKVALPPRHPMLAIAAGEEI